MQTFTPAVPHFSAGLHIVRRMASDAVSDEGPRLQEPAKIHKLKPQAADCFYGQLMQVLGQGSHQEGPQAAGAGREVAVHGHTGAVHPA